MEKDGSRESEAVLIHLEGISFSYQNGQKVLQDLSFQLQEGERVGLLGPNGSGKTTLLHIIMGLLKPDSGRIEIFGRQVKEEKDFKLVRQRIGFVFQDADDQLFSPTVLEDVAFGPLNQGRPVKEAKQVARDTLKSLGLEGFENRITYKLSGGEKRLVSLATVLAMEPEVLLLDEPTTALDAETTERIIGILGDLNMSFLFISHNMDFLNRTVDKIHGMAHGRIWLEEEGVVHTHVHAHELGQIDHTHGDGDYQHEP